MWGGLECTIMKAAPVSNHFTVLAHFKVGRVPCWEVSFQMSAL